MRLIFALAYIGIGIWAYFMLGGRNLHPYIGIGVGFALLFSSVIVCNEGFLRRFKGQSDDTYIKELLEKKQAKIEAYKVIKAITFEDLNTGCLCHLLKVGKDKTICLYGQYLYDYAEILDDPEINQKRKFPTNYFKLIRKIKNGEILQLNIGATVVEEVRIEDVNLKGLYELGVCLEDGRVISGISFEKIQASCG